MNFDLSAVARAIGAAPVGAGRVTGWSTDTRTLVPGDLFFALRGPNHDGHDHLRAAFERGAMAAVVDREIAAPGPLLRVNDALVALQRAAAWAREQWGGDVIGVTGSAGKTTTKDAIAHMLATKLAVGKTTGNYNNHVGVPLSILRVPDEARVAVIEIGMNHAGEIRELSRIAKPNIGVVTNVGYAHIEAFESVEGIAAAKRELVEALPPDGVAVFNADDPRVSRFSEVFSGRVVRFGLSAEADVRAEDVEFSLDGVRFRVGDVQFDSPVFGRHGVSNLVAGIAVAGIYGIPPDELRDAARSFTPAKMRGSLIERNGILI